MNYTNYLIIPNASLDTVALPKYVFNTYTYKEQYLSLKMLLN